MTPSDIGKAYCRISGFWDGALGEAKALELLLDRDLRLRHFELDQYPEKHVVLILKKTS